jgi:hypothetical protein
MKTQPRRQPDPTTGGNKPRAPLSKANLVQRMFGGWLVEKHDRCRLATFNQSYRIDIAAQHTFRLP